ncbi:MAG: 2-oxoglutarate dehydrogenase complex dihydrolipoyllysine-residue succinyltransferase [Desulfuromonadales bacterium]|nr:2-oxoglutarate dehydrogenase complex dihydrolipoyllysine-residue succinyltransferase [Desulfuromonadales bacterium]
MEIKVPQVGESIVEAEIAEWLKKDGDYVEKDDLLLELETEKVNVELNAEASGKLTILAQNGETVKIGAVIGRIDTSAEKTGSAEDAAKDKDKDKPQQEEQTTSKETSGGIEKDSTNNQQDEAKSSEKPMNPAVPKIAAERGIDPQQIKGSGRDGRVLVDDIPAEAEQKDQSEDPQKPADTEIQPATKPGADRTERTERVAMTRIRRKIAEHLLKATQETAMLTTFNDADMSRVIALRTRYKEAFLKKYDVPLGFMSFFVKACAEALKIYPEVNASIDGSDILYHHYRDIGVAVGSKRGLVVPVIRDADHLRFDEIETTIRDLAARADSGKLSLDELEGGTFTISNGGIYGSVLSTPLLNPPQSAILGMHAIQERAVVRDGEIVICPIMNLALSYDHRIIDGQQAVSFLKQVKTYIEAPETLLLKL